MKLYTETGLTIMPFLSGIMSAHNITLFGKDKWDLEILIDFIFFHVSVHRPPSYSMRPSAPSMPYKHHVTDATHRGLLGVILGLKESREIYFPL